MLNMSTHSLKDLRANLGAVVREVAYSGQEAIITDSGTEVAVVISMDDYERLHEHADVADALHLREMRSKNFQPLTMVEMLDRLGVSAGSDVASGEQLSATPDLMSALRESGERARTARLAEPALREQGDGAAYPDRAEAA